MCGQGHCTGHRHHRNLLRYGQNLSLVIRMKKKSVTYAGITAAVILIGMFIGICLCSYPFLLPFPSPTATLDPVTGASIDENNMLTLTGVTNLPVYANLSVRLSAVPGTSPADNVTGRLKGWDQGTITAGDNGHNTWKAEFNASGLQPADYRITVAPYTLGSNYTIIESTPLVTGQFVLGDENAGPGAIRIRPPPATEFIRVNPPAAGSGRITGITSLAAHTPLAWTLDPVANGSRGYTGIVPVTGGTGGVNRWSVTPAGTLSPGQYLFSIAGNTSPAGTISASSGYDTASTAQNITVAVPGTGDYISLDTLPAFRTNAVYTITGTTSLPAGDGLMMRFTPASFDSNYSFSTNAKDTADNGTLGGTAMFSGAAGSTVVVAGSDSENLWSFTLQTYKFSPGTYELNVSNDQFDPANMTMINGNLYTTRIVSITGDTP